MNTGNYRIWDFFLCSGLGDFSKRPPLLCNVQSSMHCYCHYTGCHFSPRRDLHWKVIIGFELLSLSTFSFLSICILGSHQSPLLQHVQLDRSSCCDYWFIYCAMGKSHRLHKGGRQSRSKAGN